LVTEWAFLLWKHKGSVEEARAAFVNNAQWYADSYFFWKKWLEFELEQPTSVELEEQHGERVKNVVSDMRSKSRLAPGIKQQLGQVYLNYLQERGGKEAMKEFLLVDRELFGYVFYGQLGSRRCGDMLTRHAGPNRCLPSPRRSSLRTAPASRSLTRQPASARKGTSPSTTTCIETRTRRLKELLSSNRGRASVWRAG
jgi:hypothetical protein